MYGTGTQTDPYWQFPGSAAYPASVIGDPRYPITRSLAEIQRPSETAIISDGVTLYVQGMGTLVTFGCEAAQMHQEGGNFTFIDGHSKRVARNAQRYLQQDENGAWYEQFFTFSK
jgi:prepilin-type processing-associated H-X9-DG protein